MEILRVAELVLSWEENLDLGCVWKVAARSCDMRNAGCFGVCSRRTLVNNATKAIWVVEINKVLASDRGVVCVLELELCVVAVSVELNDFITDAIAANKVSKRLFRSL